MVWRFPLDECPLVPQGDHPGAFGAHRKHDRHTGVDLYAGGPQRVFAVEDGEVVSVELFTGPQAGSPWWFTTQAILVRGESGVVVYGEVFSHVTGIPGQTVRRGDCIAQVERVLPHGKRRSDIQGHSDFMLHLELMKPDAVETVWWREEERPNCLLDPTPFLLESWQTSAGEERERGV